MLRNVLLFLSEQRYLRRWMETSPWAERLTRRFVAGRSLERELDVCRRLNRQGILVTVDHLGEKVSSEEEAAASLEAYLKAVRGIAAERTAASVSIKLTQFGMDLSSQLCRRNVETLMREADAAGGFVEFDMEARQYVDRTLEMAARMHGEFGRVRCAVQAYLYRSAEDVEALCRKGIPVRLCKGAYREPPEAAYAAKSRVDESYLRLSEVLLERGAYPALATHDPRMIERAIAFASRKGVPRTGFEFQMLYGIHRDLQARLVGDGYRLRLYVPYGDAWYPYFMRRLAERPANLLFLARNLLRR
ncbi:MAG TPA: proline dehydrogenase family protein [Bryobacteraceae bacterium]|nr:proline dehydrogenase family protein [Bryobacteraceae bacterium]